MNSSLCISVRFLQPYSHGRSEDGSPEWPPSPLRLMQALVAASAGHWNERSTLQHATAALRWLETLPPPQIVCPVGVKSDAPCQYFVPDNTAELLVPAWKRGEVKQVKRTEKVACPTLVDGEAVQYLYSLPTTSTIWRDSVSVLTAAARSITHLGWGIDMTVGDASILTAEQVGQLQGVRWQPSPRGGTPLRVPKAGTLDDLMRKHTDFLNRVTDESFRPVPPLRMFDLVRYRSQYESAQRPFRVFELRNLDGSRFRYPHRKLIHIAGMVRHLAIEAMKWDPPRGVSKEWVEAYVAGHVTNGAQDHSQLSYLPLPSVGTEHTDPGVRRVMIAARVGDEAWLDHVARQLAGQVLKPLRGDEFKDREPPLLVPVRRDNIARFYTSPAKVWHTFTPVILPGHDDHKPNKTRALIERALIQAGVDQSCQFEWSAFSRYRKSYSAHKYAKDRQPQGYIRPDYLLSQTAVHLTLRFHDGSTEKRPVDVPGPITIGAGRFCGFGLFAAVDD
jgi:CRISPR-associated protein Csb2